MSASVELLPDERLRVSAVVHQSYFMPDVFEAVEMILAERLDALEARIRRQAQVAPVGSMEWRAHMADLVHLGEVRRGDLGSG